MTLGQRVVIWIKVAMAFALTIKPLSTRIFSAEETVRVLLEGKSLIRFGDGEFGIYEGKSIHYQDWSEGLKNEFICIKNDYEDNPEKCAYLLAVPLKFMKVSGWELMKKRVYVSSWSQSRLLFRKQFRQNIFYGDSFLFEKNNLDIYQKLWTQTPQIVDVIFVHNNKKYADLFVKKYKKNVVFIQCPSKNSFESVNSLYDRIFSELKVKQKEKCMVVISAGPAGKVLVYRLSKQGYWCIDAGHCWDDPLEGI